VAAINETPASNPEYQVDKIEAINAIQAHRGLAPFPQNGCSNGTSSQGFTPSNGTSFSSSPNNRQNWSNWTNSPSSVKCRYCQKLGHFQKDCYECN